LRRSYDGKKSVDNFTQGADRGCFNVLLGEQEEGASKGFRGRSSLRNKNKENVEFIYYFSAGMAVGGIKKCMG